MTSRITGYDGERGVLVRVVCDGYRPFVAGAIVIADRCVQAAPILRRHVMGKTADEMRYVFRAKGWRATVVRSAPAISSTHERQRP